MNSLLQKLNPGVLAAALDSAPQGTEDLIQNLNPDVIAPVVNVSGSFLVALMAKMDPAVGAKILNANGAFLASLIDRLDPAGLAVILNANEAFLTNVMTETAKSQQLLASTASIVNSNPTFLKNLLKYLNAKVVAAALNANGEMTTNLLDRLSPSAVASIVNANRNFLRDLIGHMDPKVIASTTNNTGPFMTRLYAFLDEGVIGDVVNHNQTFMIDLVTNLSPTVVAGAVNDASHSNPDFIPTLISKLDGTIMGRTMNQVHAAAPGPTGHHENDFIGSVMAALRGNASALSAIANAVNANAGTGDNFLSDFMGSSDPTILADVVNEAVAWGFATPLILSLSSGTLADAMNAHPDKTGLLLSTLESTINPVTHQSALTAITDALNANPNLLPEVLGMLDPAVLTGAAAGVDDNLLKHFAMRVNAWSEMFLAWVATDFCVDLDYERIGFTTEYLALALMTFEVLRA